MDANTLKKIRRLATDEKNILRLALVVLTLISVLNYDNNKSIQNNEKTIITPLNHSTQFWVSSHDASQEYLISLGSYAVQLWQNYTPANATQNFSKLLEIVHPDYYQTIRQELKNRAAVAKKYNRNSYSFEMTESSINRKTKKIILVGLKTRHTKSGVKPPQKVKLSIEYRINNATFSVINLQEEILK